MCEEKGAKMAEELDYIPMPDNVVKLIEKLVASRVRSFRQGSKSERPPGILPAASETQNGFAGRHPD